MTHFRFRAFQFGSHLGYHTGMYYLECGCFKLIQNIHIHKYQVKSSEKKEKRKKKTTLKNENIRMYFTSLVAILNAKSDQLNSIYQL